MFEETTRLVRRLEEQTTASFPIRDDEEGYFAKECLWEVSLFQLKALGEDWKVKVRDEGVIYPNCGHVARAGRFRVS